MIKPVFKEIPFRDPCLIYSAIRSKNSLLFESLKGPENISRYSFIGIEPYLIFKAKNGVVEIDCLGKKTVSYRKPLQRLRELVNVYKQKHISGLPPFQGGAAGMLSYDFVRYLETLPYKAIDDLDVPDAHFFMFDRVICFDHKKMKAWVIICPGARDTSVGFSEIRRTTAELEKEAGYEMERISLMTEKGLKCSSLVSPEFPASAAELQTSRKEYIDMVIKAKEYIAAGDIFQANLSLRLSAVIEKIDPFSIYRVLRKINPSPFASFIDFGEYQIVSSSPERLVRVSSGIVDTRPIAGTRPRGRDDIEDQNMKVELLLNEKERAEHIMLIDLERNDLGKISDYGSVTVDELMTTEEYSHVIHIVSNVRGRLAEGKNCFDVLKAAFPGGTITGVPKVRCMEIIEELEGTRRGPYTGSLGYIGFNGNMDMNIIIRTFLIKGGKAYVQAGAGIVADSDPEREFNESLKKAEALVRSLQLLSADNNC